MREAISLGSQREGEREGYLYCNKKGKKSTITQEHLVKVEQLPKLFASGILGLYLSIFCRLIEYHTKEVSYQCPKQSCTKPCG